MITQKNQCLISQGFFFSDFFFTLLFELAGEKLYDSAFRFRLPNFPAFALECLPNRNSLVYGKLYGIEDEASTIFRGTLRYEGITCLWLLRICII
jgi:alpha-aminoadipic semialdehyde synthase